MQVSMKEPLACNLYAFHGFLGQPGDWQNLFDGHALKTNLKALDLFTADAIEPLDVWTAKMAEKIKKDGGQRPRILMGYSLGGRLVMHLALHKPEDWDAMVIVSAHPGLSDENDKRRRLAQDYAWAERFENDSWDILMREWNGREVFLKDSFSFQRIEKDYKRDVLAAALRHWSLGNQEDLLLSLSKLMCPVLWVAGAEDTTYAMQAERVSQERLFHPQSEVWLAPGCGHRVPWQRTKEFMSKLTLFLQNLKQRA